MRVPALGAAFISQDAGSGGRKPCPFGDAGEETAEALLRLPRDQEGARCVVSAQPGTGGRRARRLLPAPLPPAPPGRALALALLSGVSGVVWTQWSTALWTEHAVRVGNG